MSVFVAKELDDLLTYWEQSNILGELNFQGNLHRKTILANMPQCLIGSEITAEGALGRSISGFQKLRKIMMGHYIVHETNFLPRIPKEWRENISDQSVFLKKIYASCLIPLHLLKWNEHRRACIVDDSAPIPEISLQEENNLGYLPYESLYLQLKSGIMMHREGQFYEMDNIILFREGVDIRIFAWPSALLKKSLFTAKEIEKLQKAIMGVKKNKWYNFGSDFLNKGKDFRMLEFSFNTQEASIVIVDSGFSTEKVSLYAESAFEEENTQIIINSLKIVVETINGFCKLVSELEPKEQVMYVETSTPHGSLSKPRQWFELNLQAVDLFHTKEFQEKVTIHHGHGTEKSAHVRRGHWRTITHKDKTTERIWIKQTVIREDKLMNEQLQGGAMRLEDSSISSQSA